MLAAIAEGMERNCKGQTPVVRLGLGPVTIPRCNLESINKAGWELKVPPAFLLTDADYISAGFNC